MLAGAAIVLGWNMGASPPASHVSSTIAEEAEPATGSVAEPPHPHEPAPKRAAPSATSARTAQSIPTPIEGPAEIIDTTTLRVSGRTIRLYGTEWARGGRSQDLTDYVSGRPVHCDPIERSEAYRCRVGNQDLSRVVLFNGGARATFDAPPELKDAEEQARAARRGVWQN
jgi:endonuclease YncB( thermonuclease family)